MNATRKRGLGRGLDALLGPASTTATTPATGDGTPAPPTRLAVDRLEPNPLQPRGRFDEAELEELAESVRVQGVLQPIVVAAAENGRYRILAGERRWRAARRAGLAEVPVVLREIEDERDWLEIALIENLQRTDLNPIEEAEAYASLRERFGLTQDEIARRVGKGRPTVTNALRLLRLPDEILALLREERLSAGQARPLLGIDGPRHQIELARRAVEQGLSARELERLAAKDSAEPPPRRRAPAVPDANTLAAQERLTRSLQTRVEIRRKRGSGGTVRIHFHSEEELMRLFDRLQTGGEEKE